VRFRILGHLEVITEAGLPVRITGMRQRTVLAVLLLEANHVVTVGALVDALWGPEPPKTARQTVQYFVHRLRQALGSALGDQAAGGTVLVTEGGGYLLRVEEGALDIHEFAAAVREGQRLLATGDLPGAAERLEAALAVWRGPALADFAAAPFAQPAIARLEEQRLAVVEELIDVRLALGEHGDLVGELEGLARDQPLRERLCGQLMLALYRSARQAEALATFRTFRDRLVSELGLEPGAALRRLEQQILNQDPTLAAPAVAARTPRAAGGMAADDARTAQVHADGRAGTGRTGLGRDGAGGGQPAAAVERPAPAEPDADPGRGERRVLTALVAGVTADSTDLEDQRARNGQALEVILRTMSRYGGTVVTMIGGTVLAVFGVPRAREDDPERAVRTALAICQDPPEGVTIRVGVDTGAAVVAARLGWGGTTSGGLVALAGGVAGAVLDAAASLLAAAAPGEVLVGGAAYRATQRRIVFERAGEAWRPVAPQSRTGLITEPAPREQTPLVEREHELALLTGALNRVRSERVPQLVTLAGEPGIGKTRLVAELGRQAEHDPELITWRQGRSLPYGERDDADEAAGDGVFWALAEIVRAHAGILDTDAARTVDAKLRELVTNLPFERRNAATVLAWLRRLLHLDTATDVDPDQRQAAFAAWSSLIEAIADDRPLVLVFEDLHWADQALLTFINELLDRVGEVPLLVVCTARPELLAQHPDWGGGKLNTATVSLGPLSPAGASSLLDALLQIGSPRPMDSATRTRLLAAAGGNPLFLEEYVNMLSDRPAPGALAIPETVQQLITARIDLLDEPDRRLLQDLAVVGEPGWEGPLATLSELPAEQFHAILARLVSRDLLVKTRSGARGQAAYLFRHPLIREVAYGQLLREERADKHRRVAAWLERSKGDGEDTTDLLAYHYRQALVLTRLAGKPTDALAGPARHAFRTAGDRATAVGALGTAARHYQEALDLWPVDDPERAELLFSLGRARTYGDHSGQDLLVAARDGFADAGREDRAAQVETLIALNLLTYGDAAAADEYLTAALGRNAPPSPAMAVALGHGSLGFAIVDQRDRAIDLAEDALAMAERVEAPTGTALALAGRGLARLKGGDAAGAIDLEDAVELLAAEQDPNVHYVRWDLAWGLLLHGDLSRCGHVVRAGRLAAVAARAATARWFDHLGAALAYHRGEWDRALEILSTALERAAGPENGYLLPWQQLLAAQIHAGRGELTQAGELARSALKLTEQTGGLRDQQAALGVLGWVALSADQTAEASDWLDRVLALQRQHPDTAAAGPEQGLLMVALDRPADRLPPLTPTRWHLAVAALADRDFEAAAERLRRIGATVELARAQLIAARWYADHGEPARARAQLDQAAPVLKDAGAVAWMEAARALARQLDESSN
jgi:DNA-binding SARP family transcriptional activator